MRYIVPWLALLLVVPLAADTGQMLFGGSGGAVLPTADVIGPGEFNAAVDWFDTEGDTTIPLRVNYGLARGLEVGGMFAFNDASDLWGVNGKWGAPWSWDKRGATAFGARFIRVDDFDGEGWQVYAVHTHNFGGAGGISNWRASVGANWTNLDVLNVSDDAIRFFAVVEAIYRNWTFGVECQSESDDLGDSDPMSAIWARYRYDNRWTFQAGFSNAGPGGLLASDDHNIFLGASYSFGPGRAAGPTNTSYTTF